MDKMLAQWEYLAQAFADPPAVFSRLRRCHAGTYMATVEWVFGQNFRLPVLDLTCFG
jgi:hypothetical protein